MLNKQLPAQKNRQQGTILVLAGLALFMLVGFTSLALDSSLLFVARNELQNAADAGALAGAAAVYRHLCCPAAGGRISFPQVDHRRQRRNLV